MAALIEERQAFINEAYRRNPGAGMPAAIDEGLAAFREWRRGVREEVDTTTNRLNAVPQGTNPIDDTGTNSFEAFLADMITIVSKQAAATGKVNPAYAQLATQLAMAQAKSMAGVNRSSFVNPAAGSTPVGRTESVRRPANVSEALTFAGLNLALQRDAAAAPEPAAARSKPLDKMSGPELQHETAAVYGALAAAGHAKSPYYRPAAA
jgi:hypothetical protein